MIDLDKFMDSCKPYQDIIDKVTIDECISEVMGIGIWCNHEEMIKKAIVQRLLKAEQIRATMYAEIKELAEQRGMEKCKYSSCDDCECCCEVQALDWLLEQLKNQKL